MLFNFNRHKRECERVIHFCRGLEDSLADGAGKTLPTARWTPTHWAGAGHRPNPSRGLIQSAADNRGVDDAEFTGQPRRSSRSQCWPAGKRESSSSSNAFGRCGKRLAPGRLKERTRAAFSTARNHGGLRVWAPPVSTTQNNRAAIEGPIHCER